MAKTQTTETFIPPLLTELKKVIIGQEELLEKLCIGLLSSGHLLIEGMPGLAKTLAIKSLAAACDLSFNRIQFTPDLLPADITGTLIYKQKTDNFSPNLGPVFANIVLADEINRAPAKVQSALLEAMQDKQVSLGGTTFPLEDPFLVFATQNPIEQEGTYPLPEAQSDRFLLKINLDYPSREEELLILNQIHDEKESQIKPCVTKKSIETAREAVKKIYIDEKINHYVLDLIHASRNPKAAGIKPLINLIDFGASPRGSESLIKAAQAHAFIKDRDFVSPEDIKAIGHDALRHRIIPSFEAEAEGLSSDNLVSILFNEVEVP